MLKVTNVTHAKDLDNAVKPTVLKIDNVMLMFIGRKFVNVSAKSTAQCVLEKRKKCGDCKNLPHKCTINGNNLLIYLFSFLCQTSSFGSVLIFKPRNVKLRSLLLFPTNRKHHKVMYYPKYHCELNHIEHFWCSAKKWA